MRDEPETTENAMTEPTPDPTTDPVVHELWDWLDEEARDALLAGGTPTEAQLDAAADRRREAESPRADVVQLRSAPATSGGVLAIRPGQTEFDEAQVSALIAHCGLGPEVPRGEARAFLHICQLAQLDPFKNEVYLIGRKEKDNRIKYTVQTGIDGFRTIAERTGQYRGKEGPWWCGPDGAWNDVWLGDGPPTAARVTIHRDGLGPLTATVLYREFVPMKKVWENAAGGRRQVKRDEAGREVEEPMGLWPKMPAHMLAKCAEALAIRQAFPRQAGGIYVEEEMHQADARAAEDAELERARQRRELVGFTPAGPGDPATPADTATGEVLQGEVVPEGPIDREALMAELAEQARLHATTVPAMTRRWAAAHRKNLEDATDAELAALVRERRASSAERAVAEVAATTEVPAEAGTGPQDAQDGPSDAPGDGAAPVHVESAEELRARREAVEERAREVAREQRAAQRRERTRADKGLPPTETPEQGTLGDEA